jgi:hypothetical protein
MSAEETMKLPHPAAQLHAILTDGAPMNETVLCEEHFADWSDSGMESALDAEDAPEDPEYVEITAEFASNNDSACTICAGLRAIDRDEAR